MFDNPIFFLLAGLIPLVVGAVWYNPKVFGNAWMKAAGKTEEELAGANMFVIFGLTYLLSVILAVGVSGLTIHQNGVFQLFAMDPNMMVAGTETGDLYKAVMDKFGDTHRSFGHGMVHGAFASVLIALPLIAINALFERRGGKYILIHYGYWLVTLLLMCGVVCQFV